MKNKPKMKKVFSIILALCVISAVSAAEVILSSFEGAKVIAKLDTLRHLRAGRQLDSTAIANLESQVRTDSAAIAELHIQNAQRDSMAREAVGRLNRERAKNKVLTYAAVGLGSSTLVLMLLLLTAR